MTAWNDVNLPVPPGLDPGVAPYVAIMLRHGVETFESCQGGGGGHSFPEPTIRFHGQPGDGAYAYAVARTYALPVAHVRRTWTETDGELVGPVWEIVFRKPALVGEYAADGGLAGPPQTYVEQLAAEEKKASP